MLAEGISRTPRRGGARAGYTDPDGSPNGGPSSLDRMTA